MVLPMHRRYESIFFFYLNIQWVQSLVMQVVAKSVQCDVTTVKYWIKRWKQSKDLSNSIRSDRTRTGNESQTG